MKILYTTDQTYKHGGIEKVLSQKANYLADVESDEVFILTYNQQGRKPVYKFSEKIKLIDLGVNYVEGTSYFHPKNLLKISKHKKELRKALQKIKPDVLISCSFGPDFYLLPDIEKKIPKIKEFHSSRYFADGNNASFRKKIQKKKNKETEKKYDALVVLNNDEKQFYNNKNINVIPNPAEDSDFKADLSSKRILAAGRISPVKNFDALVEIFSKVHPDFPDWELHFYGEDYLGTQKKIEKQIADLGLEKSVKFMEISANLKETMQHYSIYAMTSVTECFPMVLLEALSCGIPVITYDAPTGPKHIVTDQSDSFMVPYKNLDIFAEKLKLMMEDENLRKRFGKNAKKNIERFNTKKIMNQWKSLFNQLIYHYPTHNT